MPRPFRLKPPAPSELDIHAAAADALNRLLLPPAVWCTYPAGHIKLSAAEVSRLSRIGLKRGWPDILLLYEGLIFGVELKRQGGQLSKTVIGRTRKGSPRVYEGQVDVFPKLEAAGMTIAVVRSVEELLQTLSGWGIPVMRTSGWGEHPVPQKVAAA